MLIILQIFHQFFRKTAKNTIVNYNIGIYAIYIHFLGLKSCICNKHAFIFATVFMLELQRKDAKPSKYIQHGRVLSKKSN